MADENYPRDVDDQVDPADLAAVERALAGLDFLRPDGPTPVEPMPDWAWDRLSTALAAEAARAASAPSSGRSRLARWGGGLVAASVAVVAVGVGVTAFQGNGSGGAAVAGDAAAPAASVAALSAEAGPERLAFAGISPAQMLVDSDTDYTAAGLRSQVRSVLSSFGVGDEEQAKQVMAADAPVEIEAADVPTTGFLSSEASLRDCITKLTRDAEATALMVDRSTYEGQDAGVVVAPEDAPLASAPDMNELLVWVVDEDCDILVKAFTLTMRP
jgi:ketosteroid isomerase-like protein